MAATFAWCEDNGAASGSPAKGTTRGGFGGSGTNPTNMNWKTVDDVGSAYASYPISVPASSSNYSMPKYQYGYFSGTFNEISAGLWSANTAITSAFPTGVTLTGEVTSTYATPAVTDSSFATDYTSVVAIGSGETVQFSTTGPEDASPTATLAAAGYTQYLATQLVVASTCTTPGDTGTVTATLRYNEN